MPADLIGTLYADSQMVEIYNKLRNTLLKCSVCSPSPRIAPVAVATRLLFASPAALPGHVVARDGAAVARDRLAGRRRRADTQRAS